MIAAVVLAGGRAARLGGVNKALLPFDDGRLADRALAAVAGCAPVLLAVGHSDYELAGPYHVCDLATDYAGPVAGLTAAVAALAARPPDLLLSLAVDTPFFPHDFVARALPRLDTAPAVLAAYAGQLYPTNGLWRFGAIADLPARLAAGTAPRSLKRFASELGAMTLDYAPWAATDPFLNVNTPADLAALRARATEIRQT
jgi:molybdopterin-guanine dinucleotide biosynthesis protein A